MKKVILISVVLSCIVIVSKAQDKAFHKGVISADLGVGIAIYGTKSHTEYDSTIYGASGNTVTRVIKDKKDAAASSIIPIGIEYGVTDWLGIGARFGYSKYIASTSYDTVNGTAVGFKPKVTAIDFGLSVNFHLVKSKRFDMPIGLLIGYSHFNYRQNNPDTNPVGSPDNGNTIGKDGGLGYGIMLTPRIYFGDHIGMFINVGYMGYSYSNLSFSNNSDSNLNDNNNWKFSLKGNGFNMGIGLVAKF